jgi:hypothetical protein
MWRRIEAAERKSSEKESSVAKAAGAGGVAPGKPATI